MSKYNASSIFQSQNTKQRGKNHAGFRNKGLRVKTVSVSMATSPQTMIRPWFLDLVPLVVVLLIVAHVLALVYWIYRLATDRQPGRTKRH